MNDNSEDRKEVAEEGILYQCVNVDEAYILKRGYKVLPQEMATKVSSVFQFVPQNIALYGQRVLANKNMKEVTKVTHIFSPY